MLKKSNTEPAIIEYQILSNKIVKAILRENIKLDSDIYTYNEYSLLISNNENIQSDIEENFDIYLAQAKENENTLVFKSTDFKECNIVGIGFITAEMTKS